MKLWRSDVGIWTLIKTKRLGLSGTTPRNAEMWGFFLDVGKYSFWFDIGRSRISLDVWVDEDLRWVGEHWFDKAKERQYNLQFSRHWR